MKKYIVGEKYKLTHQGTRTTVYCYAIEEYKNIEEARKASSDFFGEGSWAIDWNQWRENVERNNPNTVKISIGIPTKHDKQI